jgi:hypothetical protein
MVSTNQTRSVRLLLIGLLAVAAGFAIGSLSRGGAGGMSAPDFPEAMTAEEMHSAMAEVLLEPDTLQRALSLDALLERLDAENADGAAAAIDPILIGAENCDVEAYFLNRAAFDPEGAFQHAMEWRSVHKRGLGIHATVFTWALNGGALEARSFVETIEAKRTLNAGMTGLLQGWARSEDIDGVTHFLMDMPDDPNRTRNDVYITYVTGALLAHGGPDRMIEWFEGIPDDAPNDFKHAAFRNGLLQLASEHPERAVDFLDSNAGRDYSRNSLWVIAVAWQKLDPEAAFDWLLTRPEGGDRSAAFTRAMQRWYGRDKRSAARWVVQAPLDDQPELRKLLYSITRQFRRLHQLESDA